MGRGATKPVFTRRVSDQVRLKTAYSSSEMSWNLEISPVASLAIILSSERITKVLIRLRGCAGWSVPSLFATQEDRVSHVEAHLSFTMYEAFLI